MLKINKLTQLSTTSTRSKTKHKDGNEPLHKIHAYYRDPTGQRNADKNDRPPNKIWFKHVEDSEEFIKASISASKDSRGRKRKLIGHAAVLAFSDDLVAWYNGLPLEDKEAVLDEMDIIYREMLDRRFPGAPRIDARHTDKHRPHFESHIIKYDSLGKKLYATKDMLFDSPGVTALAAKGAFNRKKKVNLGSSGKRWNSLEAVNMSKHFHRLIQIRLSRKTRKEMEEIKSKAAEWFVRLKKNISELGRARRERAGLINEVQEELMTLFNKPKLDDSKHTIALKKEPQQAPQHPQTDTNQSKDIGPTL